MVLLRTVQYAWPSCGLEFRNCLLGPTAPRRMRKEKALHGPYPITAPIGRFLLFRCQNHHSYQSAVSVVYRGVRHRGMGVYRLPPPWTNMDHPSRMHARAHAHARSPQHTYLVNTSAGHRATMNDKHQAS